MRTKILYSTHIVRRIKGLMYAMVGNINDKTHAKQILNINVLLQMLCLILILDIFQIEMLYTYQGKYNTKVALMVNKI